LTTAHEFREHLRDRLLRHAQKVLLRLVVPPSFHHPLELTGEDLLRRGEELARRYGPPGGNRVVLLLLPHSHELFLLHLGLILGGHIPAILAWPTSRIDPEKYQRNLLHQLQKLPADHLVTLPRLAQNLAQGLPYTSVGCSVETAAHYDKLFNVPVNIETLEPAQRTENSAPDHEGVFLQFSGGTTGVQKAVVVTAEMLEAQLDRLREALGFGENDHIVSWLPMYHDMGLIACLWFPLWHGVPSLHIGANDWVMNPELLLLHIARWRGTFCWLPNFAYPYLARSRMRMAVRHDLSSVRGWINCSEPVRLGSMQTFVETFADWGVTENSLQASYALAENVFAVTQTGMGRLPSSVARKEISNRARSYSNLAFDLIDEVFVSSGRALRDMEIRISDADGGVCPERVSGEIQILTPSLFSGYWGSQGFTRSSLSPDGWHSTGDYGFISDGELYVIGRLKDIVIIGGQNVFPEDVEAIVNTLPAVHPGRVVAFGVEDQEYGTEALTIVAEMKEGLEASAAKPLETEIRKLILATIGIAPRYVAAVPQRWIVKSTAGKISRRETRERFLREKIARPLGAGG
jgi:acyl-CoA synthetase (AMP-forming)/AMP-acid ligase II